MVVRERVLERGGARHLLVPPATNQQPILEPEILSVGFESCIEISLEPRRGAMITFATFIFIVHVEARQQHQVRVVHSPT